MKRIISAALSFIMALGLLNCMSLSVTAADPYVWNGEYATEFDSGNGTKENPYIIKTASQWAYFMFCVNNTSETFWNKYIKLAEDIVLNDTSKWQQWGTYDSDKNIMAPANSWAPIGSESHFFRGNFDGDGHTVSGIYIRSDGMYQGLFGYLKDGTVKNVGVTESFICGIGEIPCTGGVVGINYKGTVENCSNAGTVAGNKYAGGVVSYNSEGTVKNCYNVGTIKSYLGDKKISGAVDWPFCTEEIIGGVVGRNDCGSVEKCHNTGTVTGTVKARLNDSGCIGGVVGKSDGALADSYNTGTVTGKSYTGGVAGSVVGRIKRCHNSGAIFGDTCVGGVAGYSRTMEECWNTGEVNGSFKVGGVVGSSGDFTTNCYNAGAIYGFNYGGGVVGYSVNKVTNCYNVGLVTGFEPIGGVIGYSTPSYDISSYNNQLVINCFYLDKSIHSPNSYGTALTDELMKQHKSYVGFDFETVWKIDAEGEYPYPTLREKIETFTPDPPTLERKTATTVTLTLVAGYEYRCGDGEWQKSNVFELGNSAAVYKFYQRKASIYATIYSDSSAALVVYFGTKGDVNDDGKINITDALTIFKHISGKESFAEDSAAATAADVSGDGKINISDALAIFKHIAGKVLIV